MYVDPLGVSDFYDWQKGIPKKARYKLRWVMNYMKVTETWTNTKYFKLLSDGVGEIRFEIHNRQFRPLGCYGPGKREFTILIGAEEKGNRLKPPGVLETAKERRELVLHNKEYSDEYV